MKTIRRDRLFRLAQAGKLVAVGSYHYDEMTGGDSKQGVRFPVRIKTESRDYQEGHYNLSGHEFTSSCGSASLSADGMIAHLHVHSNSCYDFRMADGTAFDTNPGQASKVNARLEENVKMQSWLRENGIECVPKLFKAGSLRGYWRLAAQGVKWTQKLADKLNSLGFLTPCGPLDQFSGNGGEFCVFVRRAEPIPA